MTTLLSSLTAPTATATPCFLPGVAVGAARSLRYRRTFGTGRWTLQHVQRMCPATVAATYAIAARGPAWDSWAGDIDPVYTARVEIGSGPNLLEAA